MLDCKRCPLDRCNASCTLCMTKDGFDRPDVDAIAVAELALTIIKKSIADGFGLDWITGRGSSAVSFKHLRAICFQLKIKSSFSVSGFDESPLIRSTRHGDTRGSTVLIDSCFSNQALDMISIFDGRAQWLQDKGSYAFAPSVPVG